MSTPLFTPKSHYTDTDSAATPRPEVLTPTPSLRSQAAYGTSMARELSMRTVASSNQGTPRSLNVSMASIQGGGETGSQAVTLSSSPIPQVWTPAPGRHMTPFKLSTRLLLPTPRGSEGGQAQSDVEANATPNSCVTSPGLPLSSPMPNIMRLIEVQDVVVSDPKLRPESAYSLLKTLNHFVNPGLELAQFMNVFTICGGCSKIFTYKSYNLHKCSSDVEPSLGTPCAPAVVQEHLIYDVKRTLRDVDTNASKFTSFEETADLIDQLNSSSALGGISTSDFAHLFVQCTACQLVMTRRAWQLAHAPTKCNRVKFPWDELPSDDDSDVFEV